MNRSLEGPLVSSERFAVITNIKRNAVGFDVYGADRDDLSPSIETLVVNSISLSEETENIQTYNFAATAHIGIWTGSGGCTQEDDLCGSIAIGSQTDSVMDSVMDFTIHAANAGKAVDETNKTDSNRIHMDPESIGESYNQIADHWNSEEFNRDNGIDAHRRALAFVKDRGNAIDVGCGSSGRIFDLLIEEKFQVQGIDVSSEMVKLARNRHPSVEIIQADITKWDFGTNAYHFISAWDSIWHLPLKDLEPTIRKLCAAFVENGVFIFTTGGLDHADEIEDSNMGVPVSYSVLGIPRTLELLSECNCVCRHLEYDQYPEQHVYIIAQRQVKNIPTREATE